MIQWEIGKWYLTRDGEVGQCVSTNADNEWEGHPRPIKILYCSHHFHYYLGGEFYRSGKLSPHDIVAGPFNMAREQPQYPMGVECRVCEDIAARQAMGVKKYGVTVENAGLNLREWLQHAYQECLDQAVYLRAAIEELDK